MKNERLRIKKRKKAKNQELLVMDKSNNINYSTKNVKGNNIDWLKKKNSS